MSQKFARFGHGLLALLGEMPWRLRENILEHRRDIVEALFGKDALFFRLFLRGAYGRVDFLVERRIALLVPLADVLDGHITRAIGDPSADLYAFGAVVVLTMFAAESFDPRLIWDPVEAPRGR